MCASNWGDFISIQQCGVICMCCYSYDNFKNAMVVPLVCIINVFPFLLCYYSVLYELAWMAGALQSQTIVECIQQQPTVLSPQYVYLLHRTASQTESYMCSILYIIRSWLNGFVTIIDTENVAVVNFVTVTYFVMGAQTSIIPFTGRHCYYV